MMTPDQLTAKQRIAQSLAQPDFSPVASPWEGVGRVASNIMGALQEKHLDKIAAALATHQSELGAAVQAGTPGAAAAALVDPSASQGVQTLARLQWQHDNPKPSTAQPYRWRDNAGNLQEIGPDGQPHVLFVDPTARYTIQGDQAVATPNAFLPTASAGTPAGMVSPAAVPAGAQGSSGAGGAPATLPPDFDFADDDDADGNGGAPRNAAGGFPF